MLAARAAILVCHRLMAGDAERWQNCLQEPRLEVLPEWMEDDAEATDIDRKFLGGDAVGALSAW